MIDSMYYPQTEKTPTHLDKIVNIFRNFEGEIGSDRNNLESNDVLACLSGSLLDLGYKVERSKKGVDRLVFPVLHGINGKVLKAFNPDAYNEKTGTILEIEAGRAVDNNEYLKDIFKAFLLAGVDYLALAVRKKYRKQNDFDRVNLVYQTLFLSRKIQIPIKGVLLIGY